MSRIGVMICGHGSRDDGACDEFRRVVGQDRPAAAGMAGGDGLSRVRPADHPRGPGRLRARGVDHVLAVPGMLFAAGHVKNDVPSVLNAYAAEHGLEAGDGPRPRHRRQAAGGRARPDRRGAASAARAMPAWTRPASSWSAAAPPTATPTATSPRSRACCGRAWASPMPRSAIPASPTRAPRWRVERAVRLGFRRVVVFPYFLFTGVLVRRIYEAADAVAARHPEVEFLKAHYLDDHPLVIETFVERIRGIDAGDVNMNCSLCKYRTPDARLRARPGRAAGEPPPPCRGHRHRRRP